MATVEEIKKILEENTYNFKEYKKIKFVPELFENKIEYDSLIIEIIASSLLDEIDESKAEEISEFAGELFKTVYEIYETFDLFPHLYSKSLLTESDIVSERKLVSKLADRLNEELEMIYEACKKKAKKKKQLNEDESAGVILEACRKRSKQKLKKKLQEGKSIDDAYEYAYKYTFLSELLDRILFPNINYKYFEKKDEYIKENELDEDAINKLFEQYEEAKEKLIDSIIG